MLFSGDKLLGGPQCGIMAGTEQAVGRVERDPLDARLAARQDDAGRARGHAAAGAAIADRAAERIPLWSMIATPVVEPGGARRASSRRPFAIELGLNAAVVPAESYLGGGSAPVQPIPTVAVAVSPPFPTPHDSEAGLARALRQGDPPVVTRVQKGLVLFDLRTVAAGSRPGSARRRPQSLS